MNLLKDFKIHCEFVNYQVQWLIAFDVKLLLLKNSFC